MSTNILPAFFLVILLVTVAVAEPKIICIRKDGNQQKPICQRRFATLKNNEYRSMLQAIADRQVALSGSLAFRRPSNQIQKPTYNQLSYQDIMHNLLMKTP